METWMVSQSRVFAKLMVVADRLLGFAGQARMKSPWMVRPSLWQSRAKSRARSTVAALLDVF